MNNKNPLLDLLTNITLPKKLIILAIFISSLGSISGLFIPLFAGNFVDKFSNSEIELSFIFLLSLIFILNAVLSGIGIYLLNKIGESVIYSLRKALSKHIIHLKISFFDANETGNLISRLIDDVNVVNQFFSQKFPNLFPSLLILVGSFVMLILIDWQTTLLTFILVPTLLLIMTPLSKTVQKISIVTQNRMADFSGNLNRILSEMRLVKTSGTEAQELKKVESNLMDIYKQGVKKAKITAIIQPISGLLIVITIGGILVFGGIRVSNGDITTGNLISMIFYVVQLSGPLAVLAAIMTEYQEARGASIRLSGILNEEKEYLNRGSEISITSSGNDISFNKVSFKYNKNIIFKDLSFSIPHNKTTAIVGPSGSGKTTILNILERLYPIYEGDVLLNDKSIFEIPLEQWRNEIGYIMQSYNLMNGSVKDNLLYGINRKVSNQEIEKYTKLANCYNFIVSLECGFETLVGERGVKLSTGQAQRINIARNFIKNPPILFLDEATASLDSENESHIQNALNNLLFNRTTIVIAHRLSTIQNADKILFLENGIITGEGTHKELMENHHRYNHFVTLQNKTKYNHK